jgi:predicted nucleic acid-binding protein
MIAADTSTWIAYLAGDPGNDIALLEEALKGNRVVMIPTVLTELLSDPQLPAHVAKLLTDLPMPELQAGFWQRAGTLRAKVLSKKRRARLGDALIAQTCLDSGTAIVTRDKDFEAFAQGTNLKILR